MALVQDNPVLDSANDADADVQPTLPSKSATTANSSTSSAPTPSATISDSEYSTPATSNAVTPAPSVSVNLPVAKATATASGRRSILALELPDIPQDMPPKPQGFRSTRRRSAPVSYKEDSEEEDDDDYFPGDTSRSAAMARKLQREEDLKATSSSTFASHKTDAKGKGKLTVRGKRILPTEFNNDDDEDEEDELSQKPGRRDTKKLKLSELRDDNDEQEEGDDDPDSTASAQNDPTPVTASELSRRITQKARMMRKKKFEDFHPDLVTMWTDLEKMPALKAGKAKQPDTISRQLKPFQLEGLAWMVAMEKTKWKGGLLGDEMGLGKTIQAVSLIMSDHPAKAPSLVLVPPVALMQWTNEIESYTNGKLKTFIYHGTNTKVKKMTVRDLKKFDVIMMSYNSLESMFRKQEKGVKRKEGTYMEKSPIHMIKFHRVILDEAHSIKVRRQ